MARSYYDFYPHGDSARLVETRIDGDWMTALALYLCIAATLIGIWGLLP